MKYQDFTSKVKKAIEEYVEETAIVRLNTIKKNNGVELSGITIMHEEQNITPTVYLEEFYCRYEEGESFGSLVKEIIDISEKNQIKEKFNVSFFSDYEQVKSNIVFKLVNAKKNADLLKEIPYIMYLDMAIVFYYLLSDDEIGSASILIYTSHMDVWGVTAKDLYRQASSNTPRLLGAKIENMEDIMREILLSDIQRKCHKEEQEDESWMQDMADQMLHQALNGKESIPMYVLSNQSKHNGASCLLYHDILNEFALKQQKNLYILPSSIHEVILITDNEIDNPQNLCEMVKDVNETQVAEEEVLSDSVYYYDRKKGELEILNA